MSRFPIAKFNTRYVIAAAISCLVLVGGSIAVIHADANSSAQAAAPAAPNVDVAVVEARNIIDWQNYSGRLEAVDRVEIRPQVSGVLTAVHFQDGSLVKKGDVLFTIDPRPYAAEVARAEAQQAGAEARVAYTAADVARGERLLADNAIAKRDFEEKQNAAREAAANLLSAQATLRIARLNLEYTQIKAPIDGRMSRAEVTVGNLVTANAGSSLTTLVSSSRIYASFDVDEQTFLKFVNPARTTKGTQLPVYLGLADEAGFSRQGSISSVDNRLDTSSGTIRVRAVFDNPDGQLVPGLYARIRLGGSAAHDAVLVDEKAIGTDQDKRFVLVVDASNKTAYREVHPGATQDGLLVIEDGLKPGERIVVNGLQRVHPGDAVTPQLVPMTGTNATSVPSAAAAAVRKTTI